MKQTELRQLLGEFASERLGVVQRHEAWARAVGHYDFNNTYQYVIAREEEHLTWLQAALAESGAESPAAATTPGVPAAPPGTKTGSPDSCRGILEEDARRLGEFVDRWRPRLATMTHARHRRMLEVVLGESLEHNRLFEQAAGGFEDVLGRRTRGAARTGAVLPTRWVQ